METTAKIGMIYGGKCNSEPICELHPHKVDAGRKGNTINGIA
jgi:hypothetical protein